MRTLEDIENIPRSMLSVMDICDYLEANPHVIRRTMKRDKKQHTDSFGFPVMICGNRIKIPKEAFIRCMRGKQIIEVRQEQPSGPFQPIQKWSR